MNKIAIIETAPIPKNPIDAHVRNAIILARELPAILLSKRPSFKGHWNAVVKHIILSYGTLYVDKNVIQEFLNNHPKAQLWFLSNEYNIMPNSSFVCDREWNAIASYDREASVFKGRKMLREFYTFDLNLLLYKKPNEITKKKYGLIYFGAWRPDRKDYFLKYLNKQCYISTSKKNAKRFLHGGCEGKLIGKLNWQNGKETLNNFRYTIYIEDTFSHMNYTYLANRLYEALYCNVIVFFDISCLHTLKKSGIKGYEPFLVEDAVELKNKMKVFDKDFEAHLREQRKWNKGFAKKRAELINDLRELLN